MFTTTDLLSLPASLPAVTITGALGAEPKAKGHIRGAVNLGVTREEMVDLCFHNADYCSVSRPVNSLRGPREVFDQAASRETPGARVALAQGHGVIEAATNRSRAI